MMLIGCSGGQDKVVINYCKALEAGKLDEAASYLSKDAKQELERAGGSSLLAAAGAGFKQRKGIKEITISKKKVSGESAVVELIYNFNDGSKIGDSFPLVKENGTWKITK
jgi:predicted Zn-dependent protease